MREKQRNELHKTIWSIADKLRGSVDGWDFKAYVLITLFYRFISEDLTNYINEEESKASHANNANKSHAASTNTSNTSHTSDTSNATDTSQSDFDYTKMSDKEAQLGKAQLVKIKGYFIAPSELFSNLIAKIKADSTFAEQELNEALKKIFLNIEASATDSPSEANFKSLFEDFNFNDKALGATTLVRNKKLAEVLFAIAKLDFGDIKDGKIDLFGDAYEYLMRMYASNAGKSGGEYFTPQEVSRLLALIASSGQDEINKAYDPACGSGSLLLQVGKVFESKKQEINKGFYGQEKNLTSYNLCRMNMLLHHINYDKIFIAHGDTLMEPDERHRQSEPFDIIVSNPPYSTKWEGADNAILVRDSRFSPAGVLAPKSKSDLAFVMHILAWLSEKGTAAIVEFPGVLYRAGAEAKIRQYLIKENFIDCIIQLPENLFFGPTIATCIIVLKKNKKEPKTLFINASEFFTKATNKNKLSDENINQILSLYERRENVAHLCALIDNAKILENDANLSVSSYVEARDTKEKIDIRALNADLTNIVARQSALRKEIDKIVAQLESENG